MLEEGGAGDGGEVGAEDCYNWWYILNCFDCNCCENRLKSRFGGKKQQKKKNRNNISFVATKNLVQITMYNFSLCTTSRLTTKKNDVLVISLLLSLCHPAPPTYPISEEAKKTNVLITKKAGFYCDSAPHNDITLTNTGNDAVVSEAVMNWTLEQIKPFMPEIIFSNRISLSFLFVVVFFI